MKEWLRQHPAAVPPGLDATSSTSHRPRDGLRSLGWSVQDSDSEVRLVRPEDADKEAVLTFSPLSAGLIAVEDGMPVGAWAPTC